MNYKIRKNTLNDFKYIIFKFNGVVYKGQAMQNGYVHLWQDKSAFGGDCKNLQLLKRFNCSCNDEDFDKIYDICLQWLKN